MKRIFGLDLVRVIAVIMVISVHFFQYNGFYDTSIDGIQMFFSIILRCIFYNGVSLFLLLTGYLKKDKKLEKKYYKGLKRILISYLFISFICILFKKLYLHDTSRILELIISVCNFTCIKHAWYIEMYIGFFLLIPFLNILYNNLKKDDKKTLIKTMILLVSIAPFVNYFSIDGVRLDIISDWWEYLYPITYYFIGAYISEYQIKIKKSKYSFILMGLILLESILIYTYNHNEIYNWNFIGGYASLQTIVISTIIFLLFYDIKCADKKIINMFKTISILSLDIYLFSYMVETFIYDISILNMSSLNLEYMLPCVLIIFIISFILSYLKKILFSLSLKKSDL